VDNISDIESLRGSVVGASQRRGGLSSNAA
jgi:hypothetical protein